MDRCFPPSPFPKGITLNAMPLLSMTSLFSLLNSILKLLLKSALNGSLDMNVEELSSGSSSIATEGSPEERGQSYVSASEQSGFKNP